MDTYGETEPVSYIVGWRNWIDATNRRVGDSGNLVVLDVNPSVQVRILS